MGCFSFLCKKSGKPALSTSFSGSACKLYLLKDGKVIEMMHGNYDSYGRVFKNELRSDVQHELHDSFEWSLSWGEVCNLMFKGGQNGIALVLDKYDDGTIPEWPSEDDPNQGWGGGDEEDEDDVECFGSVSPDAFPWVENPFHKVY